MQTLEADSKACINDNIILLQTCYKVSEKSFEFEEKREQSLINQSSLMITAFSFLAVAVLMIIPMVIDYLDVNKSNLFVCVAFVMTFLIISMVCALFVQWRWKYKTLPSPKEIYEFCSCNKDDYSSEENCIKNTILTLEDVYQSKKIINDKRVKFIMLSICFFLISIFCIVISVIILK